MDATQKLARFMDEVNHSTRSQIEAARAEAERQADLILSEAETRCKADAEREINSAKGKVDAKFQKRISQIGYRGKTALLSRRQALLMRLFADLRSRLTDFTETDDYAAWLVSLLQTHQPEEHAVILLRQKDLHMQDTLQNAVSAACQFRADDSILIGGLSILSADGRRCGNHTLDEAFSSQMRNFYRTHKIGADDETGGEA